MAGLGPKAPLGSADSRLWPAPAPAHWCGLKRQAGRHEGERALAARSGVGAHAPVNDALALHRQAGGAHQQLLQLRHAGLHTAQGTSKWAGRHECWLECWLASSVGWPPRCRRLLPPLPLLPGARRVQALLQGWPPCPPAAPGLTPGATRTSWLPVDMVRTWTVMPLAAASLADIVHRDHPQRGLPTHSSRPGARLQACAHLCRRY
jgi:hypothetical protein